MDNQSSPVQILSPVIPNSWCPSGTFADIFNSYNQLYLNNSTVNIPYLNEVTPQQIQTLQQNVLSLQNAQNAVNWQSGSVSVNAATYSGSTLTPSFQNIAITLTAPLNSANYDISGYFNYPSSASGGHDGSASWGVVTGTVTTTGFTIWVANYSTYITSFTWQAANLGAL